jgi:hypothetical protein
MSETLQSVNNTNEENSITKCLTTNSIIKNKIYRGKNLTNIYTIDEICERVVNGSFDDLYIGDYITVSIPTTNCVEDEKIDILFAGFNLFFNRGSSENKLKQNHIVCIPRYCFKRTTSMNIYDTTEGGYKGSVMNTRVLPYYARFLQNVLNNHILTHEVWMTNAVDDTIASEAEDSAFGMVMRDYMGATSGAEWVPTQLCLMSETNLYGEQILGSSPYDVEEDDIQFPIFRSDVYPENDVYSEGVSFKDGHMRGDEPDNIRWYWLSTITNASSFAIGYYRGFSYCFRASLHAGGVRPYFLIG